MPAPTPKTQTAPSQRVRSNFNQWGFDKASKLKAARLEAKRRASLKYRHENIEERRTMERLWHRKKEGLPLEAPKMKPWDHAKGKAT